MTDAEQAPGLGSEVSEVSAAIEALLNKPASAPEPETDDEASAPVQEVASEEVTPVAQPAEAEANEEPAIPEQPQAVVTQAKPAVPEAAKTQPEADKTQDDLLAQLNSLVPQLQAAIAGEFRDIKTFEDLNRVAAEDPGRYNRYVIHQAQLQHAQAEQQKLTVAAHGRWYQAEAQKLLKAIPELSDPIKGVAIRNELRSFALGQGYSEQQIAFASAADVQMIHKAMQYEKGQAALKAQPVALAEAQAKAKEKAAQAPKVQKPGVATDGKRDKAQEAFEHFQKTGKGLADYLTAAGIA